MYMKDFLDMAAKVVEFHIGENNKSWSISSVTGCLLLNKISCVNLIQFYFLHIDAAFLLVMSKLQAHTAAFAVIALITLNP